MGCHLTGQLNTQSPAFVMIQRLSYSRLKLLPDQKLTWQNTKPCGNHNTIPLLNKINDEKILTQLKSLTALIRRHSIQVVPGIHSQAVFNSILNSPDEKLHILLHSRLPRTMRK